MPLNVHIIPLGLDYDRIVNGIRAYGADIIYIIRGKPHPIEDEVEQYLQKLKRHYKTLVSSKRFHIRRINIFDIGEVCSEIYRIMDAESKNKLHFCISSSTKLLSAYLLFAVWSKGEDLPSRPIIYYLDPKKYVHIEFTKLARKAEKLLRNYEIGSTSKEIKEFIKQIRDLGREAGRGLSVEEADERSKYEVPFVPIKRPQKIGLEILKMLSTDTVSGQSIDRLTRTYLVRYQSHKEYQIDYQLINKTRSMLFHHVANLEHLGMLKRTRSGRKVRVVPTELGVIFGNAFGVSI